MVQGISRRGFGMLMAMPLAAAVIASGLPYTATASAQEQTLSVGFLAPLTGPDAQAGEGMKAASILALEEVDYKVGNYKIEVSWIDEGGSPGIATSNYERAIVANEIQVGMLGWRSDAASAIIPILSRYKLPHVFGLAASGLINERVNSDREAFGYYTKLYPESKKVTGFYAEVFERAIESGAFKPKDKSVALYAEDTDWGRSAMPAFEAAFKQKGWDIKSVDFFPAETTDFTAYLATVASNDVAVVAGTVFAPQAAAALVKQFRETGLNQPLVVDGLGYISNWYASTGAASDHVFDEVFVFGSPEAKEFVTRYRERTGLDPAPVSGGLAYDATKLFIRLLDETLKKHGELNSDTIQRTVVDELWTGNITAPGIMNELYKFTEESVPDPVTGVGFYSVPVVQYEKGQPVAVWPPVIAQSEGVFGAE